jgi:hypothetical protein
MNLFKHLKKISLLIFFIITLFSCEKTDEYRTLSPELLNFIDYKLNDSFLAVVDSNGIIDTCLFKVVGENYQFINEKNFINNEFESLSGFSPNIDSEYRKPLRLDDYTNDYLEFKIIYAKCVTNNIHFNKKLLFAVVACCDYGPGEFNNLFGFQIGRYGYVVKDEMKNDILELYNDNPLVFDAKTELKLNNGKGIDYFINKNDKFRIDIL